MNKVQYYRRDSLPSLRSVRCLVVKKISAQISRAYGAPMSVFLFGTLLRSATASFWRRRYSSGTLLIPCGIRKYRYLPNGVQNLVIKKPSLSTFTRLKPSFASKAVNTLALEKPIDYRHLVL